MGKTPEELKLEIERTRAALTEDVDVLAEKVDPRAAARRTSHRARSRLVAAKDHIMGAADDLRETAGDAGSSMSETIAAGPDVTRRSTQGSPLTAGLIAFGVGALVASALPSSSSERGAATRVRRRAEPLVEQAKEELSQAADDLRDELQPQVESAVRDVQDSAKGAARETVDEARGHGEEVAGHARTATKRVRASR